MKIIATIGIGAALYALFVVFAVYDSDRQQNAIDERMRTFDENDIAFGFADIDGLCAGTITRSRERWCKANADSKTILEQNWASYREMDRASCTALDPKEKRRGKLIMRYDTFTEILDCIERRAAK